MVKSAADPNRESIAAAQEATRQAYATGSPSQINKAVSEWEALLRDTFNDSTLDEQILILSSYAAALLKRWHVSDQRDDIDKAIASLEKALLQTSHVTSPERYDLLSSLGKAYYDRYDTLKSDKDDLLQAIQYWEDAHGISIALKQIKTSAEEVLPRLGNAYFRACEDLISGPDTLEQAVNYHQLALFHAQPSMQGGLRLQIAKDLMELYDRKGDHRYLAATLENVEAAIQSEMGPEHWIEGANLKTLAMLLHFRHTKDSSYLDSAIKWANSVLERSTVDPTAHYYYGLLLNERLWADIKKLSSSRKISQTEQVVALLETSLGLYEVSSTQPLPSFFYLYASILEHKLALKDLSSPEYIQITMREISLIQQYLDTADWKSHQFLFRMFDESDVDAPSTLETRIREFERLHIKLFPKSTIRDALLTRMRANIDGYYRRIKKPTALENK
ncbi:hypothetical protein CPB86DRAFT_877755 [Serendipita vermifera]|nr:hypothetical protein CPB86DRAFT_877755 [Serendipita vermifera]